MRSVTVFVAEFPLSQDETKEDYDPNPGKNLDSHEFPHTPPKRDRYAGKWKCRTLATPASPPHHITRSPRHYNSSHAPPPHRLRPPPPHRIPPLPQLPHPHLPPTTAPHPHH